MSRSERSFVSGEELVCFGGELRFNLNDLKAKFHMGPKDGVVIAGTIVEGIGNHLSDFDVYVLCEERPKLQNINPKRHHWVY